MNTKLTLLHFWLDDEPTLGSKSACGQVMTTALPGETYTPIGHCPVCTAVLERIN